MFISVEGGRTSLYKIKRYARMYVYLSKKGVTEQQLENYLIEKYNMTLTRACCILIYNAAYRCDSKNKTTIVFPTKYLDDLASLITYGTGKILGSPILRNAFNC